MSATVMILSAARLRLGHQRRWYRARPKIRLMAKPLLLVPDTLAGLRDLAAAARDRCFGKLIGVTGSAGKTSTKEMLRAALAPSGKVHAAQKSFNNHLGVPLTLAALPKDADFGVFEIGMNHAGEITPLTDLVRPHIAIVTTVAAAHLEFFASVEEIAEAKAEIFFRPAWYWQQYGCCDPAKRQSVL